MINLKSSELRSLKTLIVLTTVLFHITISFSFAEKPLTIPALKEWQEQNGTFIFTSNSQIIVDNQYKDILSGIAQTFKEDIKALKGFDILVKNSSQSNVGDIFLTLSSSDSALGKEGYSMSVTDKIVINAVNNAGVFYGTRTILQLLKQSDSIQSGTARDFPDYRERGLMIDNGRKYFSVSWLENHIKELAYLKMNLFHLHITEFTGFRLECTSYPQITSPIFYKKSEIKALQELAKKYFVTIVPEIDMPNHMSAIVEHFQSLEIRDSNGVTIGDCCIDFTKDESRTLIKAILEEYLELFDGPYWHLGTDEFIGDYARFPQFKNFAQKRYGPFAQPKDAFIDFVNWADTIVNSHGKTLRIWNDILNEEEDNEHLTNINKNIIIEHWKGNTPPQQLLDSGYNIVNCSSDRLYYIVGDGCLVTNYFLFNAWRPNIFQDERKVSEKQSNMLGSKFHVWCDNADIETETQVAMDIRTTLRLMAQYNWNSNNNDSDYNLFINQVKVLGLAPGAVFPANPIPNNLAFGKKAVASSVEYNSGCLPEYAIDGDYTSRWSSEYHDNEWIYIDLGESMNFTQVKIKWEYAYATGYKIQTSDDAIKWTTIKTITDGDGGIDDFPSLSGSGRYVRIYCTKRIAFNGNSLYEIEIYDSNKIKTNLYEEPKNDKFSDLMCFPNPFNSEINISYLVDNESNARITILDNIGNELSELLNEKKQPGLYNIKWKNPGYTSGVYFCRLISGNHSSIQKIILIK